MLLDGEGNQEQQNVLLAVSMNSVGVVLHSVTFYVTDKTY